MDRLPTEKTAGDIGREVARAIVSAIPVAGGPIQVLFENIFSAPLDNRKQAWLEQLAIIVTELQRKVDGLTPEKLAGDETFVSMAMQASQFAMRTHQREKLEALRNAVMNSALSSQQEEDEQFIFLRLIDQLTPWHLKVLAMLDSPEEWMARNSILKPEWYSVHIIAFLDHCTRDFPGRREFFEQILRDLQNEGLIAQSNTLRMQHVVLGDKVTQTTERGKKFLAFISPPG